MLQQNITPIIQGSPSLRHKYLKSIATYGRDGKGFLANLQDRQEYQKAMHQLILR